MSCHFWGEYLEEPHLTCAVSHQNYTGNVREKSHGCPLPPKLSQPALQDVAGPPVTSKPSCRPWADAGMPHDSFSFCCVPPTCTSVCVVSPTLCHDPWQLRLLMPWLVWVCRSWWALPGAPGWGRRSQLPFGLLGLRVWWPRCVTS